MTKRPQQMARDVFHFSSKRPAASRRFQSYRTVGGETVTESPEFPVPRVLSVPGPSLLTTKYKIVVEY